MTNPAEKRIYELQMSGEANSGGLAFAALGAIALGIIALFGNSSLMLVLVALLSLGFAGLVSGARSLGHIAAPHEIG